MIRITDNKHGVGIGLCRSYIEGLLRGERLCIPAGMGAPHVCLFFAEDDAALVARTEELYPDGLMPGAPVVDMRPSPVPLRPLTEREREVMSHALTGGTGRRYRNHFCASEGHDDWTTLQGLVADGFMRVSREPNPLSGGDTVFAVTVAGAAAL